MRVRKERRRKGTSTVGQSVITKVDDEDEYVDDNETTFTVRPKLTIDQLLDDSDDDNEQHLGPMDDVRTIATARTTASTKRRRQQQSALWIKEGEGDDPIDLTEPSAARSIYGMIIIFFFFSFLILIFLATKPLTSRETEAMKQAARSKRQNSRFRSAPDGRLIIDIDDEEGEKNQEQDSDDEDDMHREDIKDLMETLSLSQRAKNKRKRTFDEDDDDNEGNDDGYQLNDKKSQSVHSKYRGNNNQFIFIHCLFLYLKPVVVVFIDNSINHLNENNNDQEMLIKLRYMSIKSLLYNHFVLE
jgi:hypothetical protein